MATEHKIERSKNGSFLRKVISMQLSNRDFALLRYETVQRRVMHLELSRRYILTVLLDDSMNIIK